MENEVVRMKKTSHLFSAYFLWLIRLIALCPLYLLLTGYRLPFLSGYTDILYLIVFIFLFAFAVLPLRTKWYHSLKESQERISWNLLTRYSVSRLIRGTIWGIPFLAGAVFLIYGFNGMDFKSFLNPIQALGSIVSNGSSTIDKGLVLCFLILILFGFIYAFGWWRDTPSDYLLDSKGGFFHRGNHYRKVHRNTLIKNVLVQFLIWLPAIVLYIMVFMLYIRKNLTLSNGVFSAISSLNTLLKTPLPPLVIAELIAVLFFVHVPTYLIRKQRMAAMICNPEEKQSDAP